MLPDRHRAADRQQVPGSFATDHGGPTLGPEAGAAEPPVALWFSRTRRGEMHAALEMCRDRGWLISSSRRSTASVVVTGRCVVHLLHRLEELGAAPDKILIRSADLPWAQVRALHEALPPGTTLKIYG